MQDILKLKVNTTLLRRDATSDKDLALVCSNQYRNRGQHDHPKTDA